MDPTEIDILDLGLRIESARDARLARLLVEHAGADRVRRTARALRSRLAPQPQRVCRALGVDDGAASTDSPAPSPKHAAQPGASSFQGFRAGAG